MSVIFRAYRPEDVGQMRQIWNEIVDEGTAFPQEEHLSAAEAEQFFGQQTYCGIAQEHDQIIGLYILHPNNVGRCGHIANTSYGVRQDMRGRHIGELLVRDSLRQAQRLGFQLLQFNAVVASNHGAIRLYRRLGFQPLGTIPGGFRLKDGTYEDIIPFYIRLVRDELM